MAELSSEDYVCQHERLSIAVLHVNAGFAMEGATNAAHDAVLGAFSRRGCHRLGYVTLPIQVWARVPTRRPQVKS